jgi:hypothetical protein
MLLTALALPALGGVPVAGFRLGDITAASDQTGSWSMADGVIVQSAPGAGPHLLLVGEPDWNNYTIRAMVQFKDPAIGAEAGLVLQARDTSNYIAFSLIQRRGGPFAVLRIENTEGKKLVGDQSRLKSLDLTAWHELRADVAGTQVSCYLDGKPVASFDFVGTPPPYNSHGKTWPTDPDHGRTGLLTAGSTASFKEFRVDALKDASGIVTPQRGKHDDTGMLLPRQSYAETMQRFTDWMLTSDAVADKSKAPESLRSLPPYLLTNFMGADDQLWLVGGEFAFNHALLITGAVQYYLFSGNDKYLEMARQVADWHLTNRTPADWKFPHAPPSVVSFKPDGQWKGEDWGLEVDKSAYMGFAYLKLYAVTRQQKYLDGAKDIASTLRQYQKADGSWPFRIDAKTGEVKHSYACSQLWYVWFFNHLADLSGDEADRARAQRALRWMLDNPVKDNNWIGLYGDVPSGAKSYDQWVALETAMYVLNHRDEIPDAIEIAKGILKWVKSTLVVDYGFHRGVPGVIEQTDYKVVLTHHQLRLAELYAELFDATGDEAYKRSAIETANSVTWCLMSDGKMRQGFWLHAVACPLILSFNEQFSRIMACIPETAPTGENHLLRSSSDVKFIRYGTGSIEYETVSASQETLIVRGGVREVRAGAAALPRLNAWNGRDEGWSYSESGRLRIRHRASAVVIQLEAQ